MCEQNKQLYGFEDVDLTEYDKMFGFDKVEFAEPDLDSCEFDENDMPFDITDFTYFDNMDLSQLPPTEGLVDVIREEMDDTTEFNYRKLSTLQISIITELLRRIKYLYDTREGDDTISLYEVSEYICFEKSSLEDDYLLDISDMDYLLLKIFNNGRKEMVKEILEFISSNDFVCALNSELYKRLIDCCPKSSRDIIFLNKMLATVFE